MFRTYDAIIDAAREAWRKLIAEPQAITSIGSAIGRGDVPIIVEIEEAALLASSL